MTRPPGANASGRANRVAPDGSLHAVADRGLVWGNRGRLLSTRGEPARHSQGRNWIICRLAFNGRQRTQWQPASRSPTPAARPGSSPSTAVAVGMADGPDAGPAVLDTVADDPRLGRSHRPGAVRAHLLERLGRHDEAREHYGRAGPRPRLGVIVSASSRDNGRISCPPPS